jgi:hypothetical protein
MLAHRKTPVCLSFISTDLPIWSTIETTAFLYQKDRERFHLLLTQHPTPLLKNDRDRHPLQQTQQALMWLEISPYRTIFTMQTNSKLSYRHYWEQGVYGISRYCLNEEPPSIGTSFRLSNYTRSLQLEGNPLPKTLRVDYELWAAKVSLGNYVLHLEIHN